MDPFAGTWFATHMKRRETIFLRMVVLIATVVFFGLVFTIAYTGNGPVCFAFLKHVPGGDKTGHVVLLAILSISISWVLGFKGIRARNIRIHYGIISVFIFITIEEFCQILSPCRSFDLADLSCNYLGIFMAWTGISMVERRARTRGPFAE